MKRRKAREYALQILYQHDFTIDEPNLDAFWQDIREKDVEVISFANDLVKGTLGHIEDIDSSITNAAENWVLKRMAAVDRNILREATYEILYREDIPPAVTINEALEIAKKYASRESAAFINGILDKIAKR